MAPSPLFEFFKRGDVARDVRLLAAQGALAPAAHEQLAILVLLLEDPDPEIRRTADETLGRIPVPALSAFLARADVSLGLREFFGDRGVFPADKAADESEAPLVDNDPNGAAIEGLGEALSDEEEDRHTLVQRLATMSFTDRLKTAMKGSREARSILVRDPNKMIAAAVLSSPKMTDSELEAIARMASVSEDVLRIIASNRAWMKNYKIVVGLTRNPKTPVAVSLNLMSRLNDRDISMLAIDRNVPEPLRIAARRKNVPK